MVICLDKPKVATEQDLINWLRQNPYDIGLDNAKEIGNKAVEIYYKEKQDNKFLPNSLTISQRSSYILPGIDLKNLSNGQFIIYLCKKYIAQSLIAKHYKECHSDTLTENQKKEIKDAKRDYLIITKKVGYELIELEKVLVSSPTTLGFWNG